MQQPSQPTAQTQQVTQEMEKLRKDLQTSNVERERFKAQVNIIFLCGVLLIKRSVYLNVFFFLHVFQLDTLVGELQKSQMDLLETNNQLKAAHTQLQSAQQGNAGKSGIDEAQRKEIEAQLNQMEEVKKQLDNQAKAIESERKLFEEQRYALQPSLQKKR